MQTQMSALSMQVSQFFSIFERVTSGLPRTARLFNRGTSAHSGDGWGARKSTGTDGRRRGKRPVVRCFFAPFALGFPLLLHPQAARSPRPQVRIPGEQGEPDDEYDARVRQGRGCAVG